MAKRSTKSRAPKSKKDDRPASRAIRVIRRTPGPSIAAMAGLAAAGAAGAAAAVHFIRKGPRNAAVFDVVPYGDREWAIMADGSDEPIEVFTTKREAVKVARASAARHAPSDLAIRGRDGRVQESHSYS
jgi:hypothetical protein